MNMNNDDDRMWYRLIDGNWSPRAVAYCSFHHGYLTEKLMRIHRCEQRKCQRLREIIDEEETKTD